MSTSNPDPYPPRMYRTQFEEAEKIFESGDMEAFITAAKYNLTDMSLPPYYVMKYCILIACAYDNWDDGDRWRLYAEQTYSVTLQDARRRNDTNSINGLKVLRIELDGLNDIMMEDLTGLTKEERDELANRDPLGEDDDDQATAALEEQELAALDLAEQVDVAAAENEDEVTAETMTLPIRDAPDAPEVPTLNLPPTETGTIGRRKLRRPKSARFNPGGAYNAQQFAKNAGSIGRSSRGSILDPSGNKKSEKK